MDINSCTTGLFLTYLRKNDIPLPKLDWLLQLMSVSCHTGPALNNMNFYGLGMGDLLGTGVHRNTAIDPVHLGKGSFTGLAADNYKFKVPQLYNLKDSPFYGHGGTFTNV